VVVRKKRREKKMNTAGEPFVIATKDDKNNKG
jgi:hypothetical protein